MQKIVASADTFKIRTQFLSYQGRAGIINEIRSATHVQLHKLMVGLLVNASDSLFEYMGSIQDQKLMNRYFNVMRGLKKGYKDLMFGFDNQMSSSWEALLLGKPLPSLQSIGCETAAIITCFSRRAADRYAILLGIFDEHMAALFHMEEVFHPLCPEHLYLSFWQGTQQLHLTDEERLLLVPLFSRFVTDSVGITLADANEILVNKVEYGNA